MQIDAPLVRRLIAAQFPDWADLPVEPVASSGWDNRTFHLGSRMSVRLPSAAHYAAQVMKEQTWLPQLAPHLALPIPTPLALGQPDENYPWHWSVYRWLDGIHATRERIADLDAFAADLASFLAVLQKVDTRGAPPAGKHNFFRGGSLGVYDAQTRASIEAQAHRVDATGATAIWESALSSSWDRVPVWVHGDVAAGNLLLVDGRLSAVIDFGGMAIGDPACDMVIGWTLLDASSRARFRSVLGVDDATWMRGRGWALWKALLVLADPTKTNAIEAASGARVIDELFEDSADV